MGKSIFAAVILSVLALVPAYAQYRGGSSYEALYDSETVSSFKEHIRSLSAMALEGRGAGTDGEREAASYLENVFSGYGLDILPSEDGGVFGIRQENGDTLTSLNVTAFIPGHDKTMKDKYIVIAARMDNIPPQVIKVDGQDVTRIFPGANSNASGMAMLLELGRMLKTNEALLKRSVLLLGFGASMQGNAGAWYFLNRSFKDVDNIDAMINLDILGTGNKGFYAYTCSNADMNNILDRQKSTLQPVFPTLTAAEPFPSDHRMFYDKEIPSILFTTGNFPEKGTERDTESVIDYEYMERELEYIYSYTLSLANGAAPVFNPSDLMRKKNRSSSDVVAYYDCDIRPTFMGSSDPSVFLKRWVYQYMKYPHEAVENGRQGRVLVDFIIDERGKVTDVKVLRGVDDLLDAEAVRVVAASPDWKPGRVRGQKVKTEMSLYVEFRLQKKASFGLKK